MGNGCVTGLIAGVYKYDVRSHALNIHLQIDARMDLAVACLNQGFIKQAPIDLVICAVYIRTLERYGERGLRYVHMEAGHLGQNVSLQSISLGLVTVMVGAFDDEQVSKLLTLEERIKPLYIIPIGKSV